MTMSYIGQFAVPCRAREAVDFLVDPYKIARCIPDAKVSDIADSDHFSVAMRINLGPFAGYLRIKVEIRDKKDGNSATLLANGSVAGQSVYVDGRFSVLQNRNSALVEWSADAQLGGLLGKLPGEVLDRFVQEKLRKFVQELRKQISGEANMEDDGNWSVKRS